MAYFIEFLIWASLIIGTPILAMLIIVSIGWGLVELVIEFNRKPPGKGIYYFSSPIDDIIARSMKEDYHPYPTRVTSYRHPETRSTNDYNDLMSL
jgi:hypothetical protein